MNINGDINIGEPLLRDYFAAQALVGLLSVRDPFNGNYNAVQKAYKYADEMLRVRKMPLIPEVKDPVL